MIKSLATALFIATASFVAPADVEAESLEEEKAARHTIRVHDHEGNPVKGLRIRVESGAGRAIASATTSSDGLAAFEGLSRGRHRAVVSDETGDVASAVVDAGADAATTTIRLGEPANR